MIANIFLVLAHWTARAVNKRTAIGAVALLLTVSPLSHGQVLLDDKWADGSRAESKRPAEAAVWVGRAADVTVSDGVLSTKMGEASQKIWTYFTDAEPTTLAVGQTLTASISFIPRVALSEGTSRSLRIGLFHDPTSPRVESDVNDDGGGNGSPWTDSQGYAVQVLIRGGENSSTKPFDLGKRANMSGASLLGTSGDYIKMSGGPPFTLKLDTEYRLTLSVEKVSDSQVNLSASLFEGAVQRSTMSLTDDGSILGTAPICDKFDQLFLRIANNTTTTDQLDITNFKVEVTTAATAPATTQ